MPFPSVLSHSLIMLDKTPSWVLLGYPPVKISNGLKLRINPAFAFRVLETSTYTLGKCELASYQLHGELPLSFHCEGWDHLVRWFSRMSSTSLEIQQAVAAKQQHLDLRNFAVHRQAHGSVFLSISMRCCLCLLVRFRFQILYRSTGRETWLLILIGQSGVCLNVNSFATQAR